MLLYIIAGIFVSPLGEWLSKTPVSQIDKLLPAYYFANGVFTASQILGTSN